MRAGRGRTGATWRWSAVVLIVAVLATLPWAIGRIPAGRSDLSAATLLSRIEASADVPFSGYAESVGGLVLPATDQFSDIANLLGDRTSMRVWYRDAQASRVDAITYTGETDVYVEPTGNWVWTYETSQAVFTPTATSPVTIPTPSDVLPPQLARRVLSGALDSEISRIDDARVAGRTAVGLRLVPSAPASTIARVEVWADASTGLPLRVAIYPKSGSVASMDSAFLDVSLSTPATSTVTFAPPSSVNVQTEPGDLIQRLLQRVGPFGPAVPAQLGGFPRSDDGSVAGVALYGQGVTTFVALRLSNRFASTLRDDIAAAPQATQDAVGLSAQSGVLSLLVTGGSGAAGGSNGPGGYGQYTRGGQWLLAGTVDVATLRAAAATLGQL
jgi:outer membrane lipoprotein-sorting protein